MSVCVRTLSNKLSLPFVGVTVKPVSSVDRRQLTRNVKKSATFLEEFFGNAPAAVGSETAIARRQFFVKPLEATSQNVNDKLETEKNWCTGSSNATERVSNESRDTNDKSSKQHLNDVYQVLRQDLPVFFIRSINYSIYHPEIEFENNIRGTVTKGLYEYVKQMAMLRIVGHLKFAFVKFEVLKMTMHPEDDSVKVRWRIRGLTGSKVWVSFWKYKVWNIQHSIDQLESWHDGFSTFYVDDNGKVIRHVADKMMPDQDTEVASKDKTGIAKLALFLGLVTPREFLTDMSPLVSCRKTLDSSSRLGKI